MAPLMSMTTAPVSTPRASGSRTPIRLLRAISGLLLLVLLAIDLTVLLRLREDALAGAESNMSAITLTLAEQAERTMQGVDLVLDGVSRLSGAMGVSDTASFDRLLSGRAIHETLRERLIGLPQLNALILYSLDGHVVNSSRSWPVPTLNVSDTDYFKSITADKAADMLITSPFQFRTDGTWTLFLIRKLRGAGGNAGGCSWRRSS